MKLPGLLVIPLLLLLHSCRKDSFITSPEARIGLSIDTLKFDTVFVSAGSTFRTLIIKNENDQQLRLSSLKLMGGNASVFKMNVDGTPGHQFSNLDIAANDSLFVFIQVNVNPNAANLPFVIRDSIQIEFNGNNKKYNWKPGAAMPISTATG